MIDHTGWVSFAQRVPSPNYNERPPETQISLLVIHNISLPPGVFGGPEVLDFFQNCLDTSTHPYFECLRDLKVSSHLFIRRDGSLIQCVPFEKRAWHAGESSFEGVPNCNDYSIGVELEGTDTEAFTEEQYDRLNQVIDLVCARYPAIIPKRVVGHSTIAPGRKTDPGPYFDWSRLVFLNN